MAGHAMLTRGRHDGSSRALSGLQFRCDIAGRVDIACFRSQFGNALFQLRDAALAGARFASVRASACGSETPATPAPMSCKAWRRLMDEGMAGSGRAGDDAADDMRQAQAVATVVTLSRNVIVYTAMQQVCRAGFNPPSQTHKSRRTVRYRAVQDRRFRREVQSRDGGLKPALRTAI